MPTEPQPLATRLLLTLTLLLGITLAGITVMNRLDADRWWFGAFNLYLPQMIWALPAVLLFLALLLVNRRWAWAPLLCVAWVFGPVMGLSWGLQPSAELSELPLRVMTWNVKFGTRDNALLFDEIRRQQPDLLLLQDVGGLLVSPYREFFREWQVRQYGQFVIASRLPLADLELQRLNNPGEADNCFALRCRLMVAGSEITVYNVHLLTPRDALSAVWSGIRRPRSLLRAGNELSGNVATRLTQAGRLRELLRQEPGTVIVAGDLNSPDASQVCDLLRDAGLHDAFAQGGRGYGYSYGHFLLWDRLPLRHLSFIRIDHIMMNSRIRSVRCWSGTAGASDHRPVIADLLVKSPSAGKPQ